MTIDLDVVQRSLEGCRCDCLTMGAVDELLRLARDGERWRRQRCEECAHCNDNWCQYWDFQVPAPGFISCADWEAA